MPSTESLTVHVTLASATIALRIGQHVRHRDYKGRRVTGIVHGLTVDSENRLMVDCVLDEPLVIPADEFAPEIRAYRQYAPAHEFTPLDERDELMNELVGTLVAALDALNAALGDTPATDEPKRAALSSRIKTVADTIAKATGSAA